MASGGDNGASKAAKQQDALNKQYLADMQTQYANQQQQLMAQQQQYASQFQTQSAGLQSAYQQQLDLLSQQLNQQGADQNNILNQLTSSQNNILGTLSQQQNAYLSQQSGANSSLLNSQQQFGDTVEGQVRQQIANQASLLGQENDYYNSQNALNGMAQGSANYQQGLGSFALSRTNDMTQQRLANQQAGGGGLADAYISRGYQNGAEYNPTLGYTSLLGR